MRTEAHERDRKRLRRVLGMGKWWRAKATRAQDLLHGYPTVLHRWDYALRWSAAWKAAAKKWHDVIVTADNILAIAGLPKRDNSIADRIIELMSQRDNLRIAHRALIAERDELCKRHNELFNLWEAASAEAAKLGVERDKVKQKLAAVHKRHGKAGHRQGTWLAEQGRDLRLVQDERDELQRRLKAVTDCIIHYAPTDFPILKYDSAAEALARLLDGGNTNEPNTDKPR